MIQYKINIVMLIILCMTWPVAAFANAGLPMIAWVLPDMIKWLIPIILMETYIIGNRLAVSWRRLLAWISVANIITTLVGIPLAWAGMLALQFGTDGAVAFLFNEGLQAEGPLTMFVWLMLHSAWLLPLEESVMQWLVPSATLVLLVPFFSVSYFAEAAILCRILREENRKAISRQVLFANLGSYLFLAIFPATNLLSYY